MSIRLIGNGHCHPLPVGFIGAPLRHQALDPQGSGLVDVPVRQGHACAQVFDPCPFQLLRQSGIGDSLWLRTIFAC